MYETKIVEYRAQAQLCYAKADSARNHVSKQLWVQMAQDWIVLAESLGPQPDRQDWYHQGEDKLTWKH